MNRINNDAARRTHFDSMAAFCEFFEKRESFPFVMSAASLNLFFENRSSNQVFGEIKFSSRIKGKLV